MAQQLEGNPNTTHDPFCQWLSKWEFSDVSTIKHSLQQQGIKDQSALKKYIANETAFNKLVSRLNINFVDEISLEKAWKSVQTETNQKKVVFLGDTEKQILDELYKKYDTISNDMNQIQIYINELKQSVVQSKKALNVHADAMIKIIEENRKKITQEIGINAIEAEKTMNNVLRGLTIKRKVYCKRKDQFETIALNTVMESDAKLEALQSLLVINGHDNDDQKNIEDIDYCDVGTINLSNFDEKQYSKQVYSLLKLEKKFKRWELQSFETAVDVAVRFSANHGHTNQFTISDNGKKAEINGNATVICETGYNEGKHEWKILLQCEDNMERRIGIINSLDRKFTGHGCSVDGEGISYMWRAGTSFKDIYGNKNGSQPLQKSVNKTWNNGSIVTVILDCINWTVEFIHDDEPVAKVDIEKNQTYYPVCHGYTKVTFTIV